MPPKRLLLTSSPSSSPPPTKRRLSSTAAAAAAAVVVHGCAYLWTTDPAGRKTKLWVTPGRNLLVGRNASLCHYVVCSPVISATHMRLFATKTDEDRTLVCIEDLSRNGLKINDLLLKTKSAILLPGDVISLRGVAQDFTLCLPALDSPSSSSPRSSPDPASALASRVSFSLSLGSPRPPFPPSAAPIPPPTVKFGQYVVREDVVLGAGSFGVVRLGWDAEGRQVACKSVIKARLQTAEDVRRLRNEIVLGTRANHPNLNRIFGAIDEAGYESDDGSGRGGFYHLFLQLVTGGDLFTYIESFTLRGRRMGEGECKYLTFQILQGVKYLHELGVAHRDLKPENVLLKHGGSFPTLLICDFGLATPFRSSSLPSTKKSGSARSSSHAAPAIRAPSILGTPLYFPPEYIVAKHEQELAGSRRRKQQQHQKQKRGPAGKNHQQQQLAAAVDQLDATALDVWAIGVITWIMTTGTHPFGNDDGPRPSLDAPVTAASLATDAGSFSSSPEINTLEAAIQRRSFDRRVIAGDHYPNPALASYDPSAASFLAALLHPTPEDRVSVAEALALEWMALEPERALIERAWEIRVDQDGQSWPR